MGLMKQVLIESEGDIKKAERMIKVNKKLKCIYCNKIIGVKTIRDKICEFCNKSFDSR